MGGGGGEVILLKKLFDFFLEIVSPLLYLFDACFFSRLTEIINSKLIQHKAYFRTICPTMNEPKNVKARTFFTNTKTHFILDDMLIMF